MRRNNMTHKFQVTTIESERGWGRRYERELFDTFEEAKTYRDRINSFNKPLGPGEFVPDYYITALDEILVIEL
jgi:hypothetical protein